MAVCPHCHAPTAQPGSFCVSCGKAMPSENPTGPRILGTHDLASSHAGRSLQMDHLDRHIRTGYGTLLGVSILQLSVALLWLLLAAFGPGEPAHLYNRAAFVGGIGSIFCILAFWSKRSPLPATVIGLVLFLSSWVFDIRADPNVAIQNIVIKIAIAIFLFRAVAAAIKHRALKRQIDLETASGGAESTPFIPNDQHRAAA